MTNPITHIAASHSAVVSTTVSKPLQLVGALMLGVVMLYGAGFVQTSEAHNAAHDARHSIGFPCH